VYLQVVFYITDEYLLFNFDKDYLAAKAAQATEKVFVPTETNNGEKICFMLHFMCLEPELLFYFPLYS
jgi:hypothetical protein